MSLLDTSFGLPETHRQQHSWRIYQAARQASLAEPDTHPRLGFLPHTQRKAPPIPLLPKVLSALLPASLSPSKSKSKDGDDIGSERPTRFNSWS